MTEGVNEPTDFFSVGDGVAEALLSEGALVSAGFSLVPVLQAVREPMPAIAAAPATRATRRVKRDDHIVPTPYFPAPVRRFAEIIADDQCSVDFFRLGRKIVGRLLRHFVRGFFLRGGFF